MADSQASLFEAVGGAPAIAAAVDAFYTRVLGDPTLSGFFVGVNVDRLKSQQRAFFTAALGAPQPYTGRSVAQAHAGLNIADAHFNSVARHLTATLASLGVPEAQINQVIGLVAPL